MGKTFETIKTNPKSFDIWEDKVTFEKCKSPKFTRTSKKEEQSKGTDEGGVISNIPYVTLEKDMERDSGQNSEASFSPVHRHIFYRNEKIDNRAPRQSKDSHETSEWDSGWCSSPDSGRHSRTSTPRNSLQDHVLNVPNLTIGEFEDVHLDPTQSLFLPAVKTFSWHARLDSPPDLNEDEGISPDDAEDAQWVQKQIHLRRRRTAHMILKAAVNLEEIKDFHFDLDCDLVLRTGKVPCVRHLCLLDTDNVDNIVNFAESGPQVTILQLISSLAQNEDEEDEGGFFRGPEGRQKLSKVITKLLSATRHTLSVLDLSQFCSVCIDLEIPPLVNLHQLTLGSPVMILGDPHGKPRPSRVLPRHIFLDESFPNLSVLDVCRLSCEENCNWDLYFPPTHNFQRPLSTVRVLVASDQATHFWMQKLEALCPNFVKLVLHSDGHGGNLEFMLVKIFRYWQQLEALELRIEDFPLQPFSIDSALTGLREDTCRILRIFGPAGHDSMIDKTELEKSYCRPSIVSLSRLNTLDIIFDHHCLGRLAHQETLGLPLTFVSGRYGFSYLKDLKVTIYFDHTCPWGQGIRKKFESLQDYATLKHKYDSYCHRVHHHEEAMPVGFNR